MPQEHEQPNSYCVHCAADVEKGNIEGRYSKDYEDSVNPFNHWREKERASRRSKLSVVDRLAYEMGQLIAGSTCAARSTSVD